MTTVLAYLGGAVLVLAAAASLLEALWPRTTAHPQHRRSSVSRILATIRPALYGAVRTPDWRERAPCREEGVS